jgi:PAS domain S-box-containing protein
MGRYQGDTVGACELRNDQKSRAGESLALTARVAAQPCRSPQADEFSRRTTDVFRQLIENVREVFWVTDVSKSRMIYVSPGYETIWGRTCGSLYAEPRNWLEAIHPDDRERVLEALQKQAMGLYDETYRIVRPDGSIRWIHDRAFPVRDKGGSVERVVGLAEDITGRKLAENALREAEANYRSVFENAIEGVFQTTPDGRYLSANPALARMLGYANAEELIASVSDIGRQLCVNPEIRSVLKELLANGGFVRGFESQVYRKDGSRIWISINARTVRDANGEVLYYEGTNQDITERKEAQAQIAMLAHAVESTTEPICITDLENRFIFVNRAFQETYGYTEEEVLGKTPDILFSPRNPTYLLAEILEQTQRGGWRGELLDVRKDGTEFPIFLSTSHIKDSSGRVVGLMGVAQDITERKRIERQGEAFLLLEHRLGVVTAPAQAAQVIFGTASELFPWDAGSVHLSSPNSAGMSPVLMIDTIDGRRIAAKFSPEFRDPSPLMAQVIKHGACLIRSRNEFLLADDLIVQRPDNRMPASAMVVPIHSGGDLFGILSIQSYSPDVYSEADLMLVQALADYCGGALQRIKMADSLRESERKLRLIAENTSDAIFAFDMDRRPLYVNRALGELTGYTVDEIRDRKFISWVHPEDQERVLKFRDELFEGKSYSNLEYRLVTRSGKLKWCSSSWGPLHDESGRQIGVQGRERDITQLRNAEAARRELAAIVENSHDAIFSNTLEGCIVSWNKAAERIYGYPAPEAIGRSVAMLLNPDCAGKLAAILADVSLGRTLDNYETMHRRRDGSPVTVSLSVSPVRDDCGKVTGAAVIARDITERIQLEKDIVESGANERRRIGHDLHDGLGQFLAGVSLRAKALEGSLAGEGSSCIDDARELTALVSSAIGQTRNLARGLDPIEIEHGALDVALQGLAAETEKLFGIQCVFVARASNVKVPSQGGLDLYRITQEAIHNAVKHGNASRIEIELAKSDSGLSLTIKDDGVGFEVAAVRKSGMGLRVMRYRAGSIGAVLKIKSEIGCGVEIHCLLPHEPEALDIGNLNSDLE